MNRHERILERKGSMGNRHGRKLEKYSESFNENFMFFFRLSRRGLISFCGERIVIESTNDPKLTAKHCFRLFEDGRYTMGRVIQCRQPNILRHVLMGKKGFSLWCNQWAEGVGQGLFSREEILFEFDLRSVVIPECFMIQLEKAIGKVTRFTNSQKPLYLP